MSFALDNIKEAIHALAQKSRACLTRIAQVISDIFEAVCTFISSCASQAIDFKALAFEKKLFINHAVITDTEDFTEETISYLVRLPLQSYVALEKNADLVSITEAPQIREDTQTVTLAVPQREISEIEKKAKKSEILSKFDQLCAFSRRFEASNYPLFYKQAQSLHKPLQLPVLSHSKISIPRTILPKDRNLEAQGLLMAPPPISTLNSSSIRLGMKALNLAKFIK